MKAFLRAVAVAPPFVGVLVVLGATAWAWAWAWAGAGPRDGAGVAVGDASRAGVAVGDASMKLAIGATAIAMGLVLGLVGEVLVRLRYPASSMTARAPARAFVENALVCLALLAMAVAWGMAESPQLYAARWYGRGGLARTTQVVATDVLGVQGVIGIGLLLAVIYVRPTRVAELGRRLWRGSAMRLTTGVAVLSMVAMSAGVDAGPGAGAGAGASAGARRPNVLLIMVGGLRADQVDARVAPNLVRLAGSGVRFDRAYASTGETLPSSITLLTGRDARSHGGRAMASSARELDAVPLRFAKAGYATGVVSDDPDGAFGHVELGFERVDVPSLDDAQAARARTLQRMIPLLPFMQSRLGRVVFPVMRGVRAASDPQLVAADVDSALRAMKDKPFFLTVALATARAPYVAPAPYYAKYTDPGYRGRFKYGAEGAGDGAPLDAADVKQLRGLHDGAVRAVDDAIARMLRSLEREGLLRDTIVVVTAEHGETLFEDGHGLGHGEHLLGDQGQHVPLVIHDPRVARAARAARAEGANGANGAEGQGRRVGGVVRDVDLAPTLHELAGITPPADLDGRSLAAAMRGAPLEPRFAFAETQPRENDTFSLVARQRMLRDERWKLVYVPERTGVRYILFDTADDHGETRDVAASHPDDVARLRAALWPWMLRDRAMEAQNGFVVPRSTGGGPSAREGEVEADEVALRLVDVVEDPRVTTAFAPAGRRTMSITLGAGAGHVDVEPGATSRREALVAPAPTTFTFRVTVPARAKLVFAEGIASDGTDDTHGTHDADGADGADGATTFVVTALDERNHARELHRHRLTRHGAWTEASCDLSAYAGRSITLRLATEHADTTPDTPGASGPLALWGSPMLVPRTEPRVPYDVLWIAADGLPADVVTSLPAVEALARRGVRFTNAYSAATWSRPGVVAMLGGARASELGIDARAAAVAPADAARLRASASPLFSLAARRHGVVTQAFLSDPSVLGDAAGGVDLGFDAATDHRAHPTDARALTHDATTWIDAHRGSRFFLFARFEADATSVDEAVGALTRSLDDAGLRERTIVIVTAAHGPVGSFEASTHVPMIVVAPGQLTGGREVKARVRTTDLVPTLDELLGLEDHAKVSGSSLLPLARGADEPDERVVVSEGRDARALLHGAHRLVVGLPGARLFDVAADPAESSDLAPSRPELVAEMRARLEAALTNAPMAGSTAATASSAGARPVIRLRLAGGAEARRVSGSLVIGSASLPARSFTVVPVELGPDALKIAGNKAEIALTTSTSAAVGFDVIVDPPTTPVTWDLYLDDKAWPLDGVFGGPYGLPAPTLRNGITSDEARLAAQSVLLPPIDPRRDVGLFVTRARRATR